MALEKAPPSIETQFDEEVFENQRYMPLRGWSPNFLSRLERQRFSDRLGVRSSASFPEVPLPMGWYWESEWVVDRQGNVDAEGWQYGFEFTQLSWPPKPGEERQQAMHVVRRRRYVRRRRRDHRGSVPPPSPPKNTETAGDDASEYAARVVDLGLLQPGERMSLPLECFSGDLDVVVKFRPAAESSAEPFAWSRVVAGAPASSSTVNGLNLAELKDGLSVLLKSEEERSASRRTGGDDSGFWTAALVEGRSVPVHTRYGVERSFDWLVTLAPPLLLDNALSMPAQAIVASEQGSGVFEGTILAGNAIPVHHVDPLLPLVFKYEPVGLQYDDKGPLRIHPNQILASRDSPLLLSCNFRGVPNPAVALQGNQMVTGFVTCRTLISEGFGSDWTPVEPTSSSKTKQGKGSLYAPMQLRMFSPVSIQNRSELPVQFAVVDLGPVQRSEGSQHASSVGLLGALEQIQSTPSQGALADGPRSIDVSDPRKPLRSAPLCATVVSGASLGLASYPILQTNELFGLQLRVEGSGWSEALPLANHQLGGAGAGPNGSSHGGNTMSTGSSSAYLMRFTDHASGLAKEVLVSFDLGGGRGQDSSLQVR